MNGCDVKRFFATDPPLSFIGPQAKAGSIIKGREKNFLLKSCRQKLDSEGRNCRSFN